MVSKWSSLHLHSHSTRTITNSHWKELEWETQESLQQVLYHTPDQALSVVTTWRRPWSVFWLDTPQLIHVAHQLVGRRRFQTVETQQRKHFQFHVLTLTCFSYGSGLLASWIGQNSRNWAWRSLLNSTIQQLFHSEAFILNDNFTKLLLNHSTCNELELANTDDVFTLRWYFRKKLYSIPSH